VKHVGIVGAQPPVQPAQDPLGVSGAWIVALSLLTVGIVYQLATVICGVGDPRQHQLLAVAETGDAGCLALRRVARAGSSRPARMAMTTSSSMSVNACLEKKFHGEKFETAQ